MFIWYTLGNFELSYPVKYPFLDKFRYPVKFSYTINVKESMHDLILGLPFIVKYTYPVKASIRKYEYFSKINNSHL